MALTSRRRTLNVALLTFSFFYVSFMLINRETKRNVVNIDFEPEVDIDSDFLSSIKLSKLILDSDPRLIEVIKTQFIHPPSSLPYNLTKDLESVRTKGEIGQAQHIDRILNRKLNGFFIEAGAFDGEYLSNSLFFELHRNWTGLLVEPNSKAYSDLISKNRKAYSINSCLSVDNYPSEVTFESADVFGGIVGEGGDDLEGETEEKDVDVVAGSLEKLREGVKSRVNETIQCFPLYSLLLALDNPKVDYLSLDIEGAELSVLKTIPFSRVDIRTISVELIHSDSKAITRHLVRNGYKVNRRFRNDIIFVKSL